MPAPVFLRESRGFSFERELWMLSYFFSTSLFKAGYFENRFQGPVERGGWCIALVRHSAGVPGLSIWPGRSVPNITRHLGHWASCRLHVRFLCSVIPPGRVQWTVHLSFPFQVFRIPGAMASLVVAPCAFFCFNICMDQDHFFFHKKYKFPVAYDRDDPGGGISYLNRFQRDLLQ